MNYYEITFFKKSYDKEKDKTDWSKVGKTEISDFGVNDDLSLAGKAFRHAPPGCQGADKLKIELVRK